MTTATSSPAPAGSTIDGRTTFRPAKLAHVVLRTAHFDEAMAWYQQVLGAFTVFQADTIAFLTYDSEHHRIALAKVPPVEARPEDRARPGLEHIGFTYASLAELLGTFRRLRAAGIEPTWSVNHGPTTSIYYEDPDGNEIELQVENFADLQGLLEWGASGAFAINPIGTLFDPEDLARRLEAGEPDADLLRPPGPDEMQPPDLERLPGHVVAALRGGPPA